MTFTNFEAVILDMDGVMVDSEAHFQEMQLLPTLIPGFEAEDLAKVQGTSLQQEFEYCRVKYKLDYDLAEYARRYVNAVRPIYEEKVVLADGLTALLEQWQAQGLKLAVASSSSKEVIQIVLDRFHLNDYFDEVVSADDVNGESKPSPKIYLHTASLLDVDPKKCLVFEDSLNGIKAAKAAGMYCVGYGHEIKPDWPMDEVAGSFKEIN
jgi:HAD superfamily hydrolase (TIGR01509 family)